MVWREVYRIRHTEPAKKQCSVGQRMGQQFWPSGSVGQLIDEFGQPLLPQMCTKIYDPSTSTSLGVAADLRRDERQGRLERPFWTIDVKPGVDPFFVFAIIAAQEQVSDIIDDDVLTGYMGRYWPTAFEQSNLKQEQARVGKCVVTQEEMESTHLSLPQTQGAAIMPLSMPQPTFR